MKTKQVIELLSELSGIFQDLNSNESLIITDHDLIDEYKNAIDSALKTLEKIQARNEAIQKAKKK